MPVHADYPHISGYLYDCPACESQCFCTGNDSDTECVYCALNEEKQLGTKLASYISRFNR